MLQQKVSPSHEKGVGWNVERAEMCQGSQLHGLAVARAPVPPRYGKISASTQRGEAEWQLCKLVNTVAILKYSIVAYFLRAMRLPYF